MSKKHLSPDKQECECERFLRAVSEEPEPEGVTCLRTYATFRRLTKLYIKPYSHIVAHIMKTTLDLPDNLLIAAKTLAA
jgi:hypothetical protein